MAKNYSELIKAAMENISAFPSTVKKGLMYFNTTTDRPGIDDGTDVSQLMLEKHLPEARRDTKVQLDALATGLEIEGTLPFENGGTGVNLLTGEAGKALIVKSSEDGYEFGESGTGALIEKKLLAPLATNGNVVDLGVSPLEIGVKYRVSLNARCVRSGTAQNEIQEITFSAVPNEGNFTLEFDGQTTAPIWYNATAADVQAALILLPNIDAAGVVVAGDFLSGFSIEFVLTEGLLNQPQITVTNNTLKSGGTGGVNEIQRFTFSDTPTSGSFTLTYNGQTTAAIAYNATPAIIKAALELLPNIQNVTVTDV